MKTFLQTIRSMPAASANSGAALTILLGILSVLLARGRDGFDKGLFLGAGIALMLMGVYVLSARIRAAKDTAEDSTTRDESSTWLPSRDQK